MHEPIILFIAGRIIERLLIVAGGIMCLWLGYRLFAITSANESVAEIGAQNFRFKAEKIGPGVFFALFGSILLGYSAFTKIHISSEELKPVATVQSDSRAIDNKTTDASAQIANKKIYFFGDRESSAEEVPLPIKAVNSLISLKNIHSQGTETMGVASYEIFLKATPALEHFQRIYIDQKYGIGSFDVVKAMETECTMNTERCRAYRRDEENRQKMDKIQDDLGTLVN